MIEHHSLEFYHWYDIVSKMFWSRNDVLLLLYLLVHQRLFPISRV